MIKLKFDYIYIINNRNSLFFLIFFFLFCIFNFYLPIIQNFILLKKMFIIIERDRLKFSLFFPFMNYDNNISFFFFVIISIYLLVLFLRIIYYLYVFFFSIFKKYYFVENQEFILYQIWHRYFSFKSKDDLKKKYSFKYLKSSEVNLILNLKNEDNTFLNRISDKIDEGVVFLNEQHNNFKDLKLKNPDKYSFNDNFLKMYRIKKTSLFLNEFWLKDVYFHYLEKHKQILFSELYIKVRKDIYIKRYGTFVVNNIIEKGDDKSANIIRVKSDLKKVNNFESIPLSLYQDKK